MADDTYNGWPNRETWATVLHLGNDKWLDGIAHNMAAGAWIASATRTYPDLITRRADARRRLADALAAWLEEKAADLFYPGEGHRAGYNVHPDIAMMIDAIGSRWRVDWPAVADAYLEGYPDEDPGELPGCDRHGRDACTDPEIRAAGGSILGAELADAERWAGDDGAVSEGTLAALFVGTLAAWLAGSFATGIMGALGALS